MLGACRMQRHFFATPNDLLPVLEQAEKKLSLAYSLTGLFEFPHVTIIEAGAQLPSLNLPAEGSSANNPTYLITLSGHIIDVRQVPQSAGGIRYAVDQLTNPDSVTFAHGGLFSPDTLISGRVATVSDTPVAKSIQSAFSNAIGKLFTRINAFYVGPGASEMLGRGCRLTHAVQSPPEYDLRLTRGKPRNK